MAEVTKESLAQWIAELESQLHLSLKEERYLAVMKDLERLRLQNGLGLHCGRTAAGWRAEALLQKQLVENLRNQFK